MVLYWNKKLISSKSSSKKKAWKSVFLFENHYDLVETSGVTAESGHKDVAIKTSGIKS